MSTTGIRALRVRKFMLCSLGILGGIASWAVMETLLQLQSGFPGFILFSIVQGMVLGGILGASFGSAEGIFLHEKNRLISGIITGVLSGIIGGALGFVLGQAALFLLGTYFFTSYGNFQTFALPLSRTIGWIILGMFVGMSPGFHSRSAKKISVGLLGGILGGLTGGLVLEYSHYFIHEIILARFVGLLLLGFFIGLFYSFLEKSLSPGVIRVLNGALKGKEFIINQRRLKVGSSPRNDIILSGYDDVEEHHATITIMKGQVFLEKNSQKTLLLVNEDPETKTQLKYEDVIRIGSARFFYKPR